MLGSPPVRGTAPFGGDDRIELGAQPFLVRAHEGEKSVVDRGSDQLVGERVAGCRVHGHHLPFRESAPPQALMTLWVSVPVLIVILRGFAFSATGIRSVSTPFS